VKPRKLEATDVVGAIVGVPLLGVLMGGVYSLPAMKVTKGKDPWLTILLAMALGLTVGGVGTVLHCGRRDLLLGVWRVSVALLLLARLAYGSLGHGVERFGLVHAPTLVAAIVVSLRYGT
jgi:hypothetical protein